MQIMQIILLYLILIIFNSNRSDLEVKENWPMFPVFHENFLLHENDANTRANQIQKYLEKLINSKQYQTNKIVVSTILVIFNY